MPNLEIFGESIRQAELKPSSTKAILARFEPVTREDQERQNTLERPQSFIQYVVADVVLGELASFEQRVEWEDCPHKNLVLASVMLSGHIGPQSLEKVRDFYCGHQLKYEDTSSELHPLSGRKGTEYIPKSRCRQTAVEITRLLKFMKEYEEPPTADEKIESEEELWAILNQRREIKQANDSRRAVYATWLDVINSLETLGVISILNPDSKPLSLPEKTSPDAPQDEEQRLPALVEMPAYQTREQLAIGSEEYFAVLDKVEANVMRPLHELVSLPNIAIEIDYPGSVRISLNRETAYNCEKAPTNRFVGAHF